VSIENWDYATPEAIYEEVRSLQKQLAERDERVGRLESLLRRLADAWDADTEIEIFTDAAIGVAWDARNLLEGK
jgi:hypothetical protein